MYENFIFHSYSIGYSELVRKSNNDNDERGREWLWQCPYLFRHKGKKKGEWSERLLLFWTAILTYSSYMGIYGTCVHSCPDIHTNLKVLTDKSLMTIKLILLFIFHKTDLSTYLFRSSMIRRQWLYTSHYFTAFVRSKIKG